jgi:hypothetical protein
MQCINTAISSLGGLLHAVTYFLFVYSIGMGHQGGNSNIKDV